jgi:hypothetical protein
MPFRLISGSVVQKKVTQQISGTADQWFSRSLVQLITRSLSKT